MSPKTMMILGATAGLCFAVGTFISPKAGLDPVVLFAAGALFGKGYGIWEARALATAKEGK